MTQHVAGKTPIAANQRIGRRAGSRPLSRHESKLVTRNRLIQAGLAVLAEQGYEQLTTGHIARRAGVAQPTFYVHFSDKDDLLQAIASDAVSTMRTALRELRLQLTRGDDLVSIARETFRLPLSTLAGQHADVLRLFVSELYRPRSKIGQSARALVAEVTRDLVDDLRGLGVVAAVPAATLELVCDALVMLTIQFAMAQLEGRRHDVDVLADLLARTTVHLLVDAAGGATRPSRRHKS